jgi:hypothetical protein
MPVIVQACIVVVTLALVAIAIATIRAMARFEKTAQELRETAQEARRSISEVHEMVDSLSEAVTPLKRTIARFEELGQRTVRLSSAVLDEVERPVRTAVALVHGVRQGTHTLLGRLSQRFAHRRSATNGGFENA